ncbi:MAG: hypothetical protein LEGION0398_MBIBDBAK_00316 [Legionellaceae bacterium]
MKFSLPSTKKLQFEFLQYYKAFLMDQERIDKIIEKIGATQNLSSITDYRNSTVTEKERLLLSEIENLARKALMNNYKKKLEKNQEKKKNQLLVKEAKKPGNETKELKTEIEISSTQNKLQYLFNTKLSKVPSILNEFKNAGFDENKPNKEFMKQLDTKIQYFNQKHKNALSVLAMTLVLGLGLMGMGIALFFTGIVFPVAIACIAIGAATILPSALLLAYHTYSLLKSEVSAYFWNKKIKNRISEIKENTFPETNSSENTQENEINNLITPITAITKEDIDTYKNKYDKTKKLTAEAQEIKRETNNLIKPTTSISKTVEEKNNEKCDNFAKQIKEVTDQNLFILPTSTGYQRKVKIPVDNNTKQSKKMSTSTHSFFNKNQGELNNKVSSTNKEIDKESLATENSIVPNKL